MAPLHALAAAAGGRGAWWRGLVEGGSLSRLQHRAALREMAACTDRGLVGGSGLGRRSIQADEPRRRNRDVGKQSVSEIPTQKGLAPAYYAPKAGGWRRDIVAVLHPPYTAWHLSYVLIGAALAPALALTRLAATLAAFLLAVGISAHALDELRGRPLQTDLPAGVLWAAAVVGLAGAVGLGLAGVSVVGIGLLPFIAAGVLFVFAYN